MKYFFAKLLPPRPTFAQDLTPAEMVLMGEHSAYLGGFTAKGWLIVYGPVADPRGAFGIGVWAVPDDVDVVALCDADPTIKSGLGFRYEISSMPRAVTRP